VTIGQDTLILPGTHLEGQTSIGSRAEIGPNCRLTDVSVGDETVVTYTTGRSAEIGPAATVGPFSFLRPGTKLGPRAHIGAYVELKNSSVGEGSKVPHLSYVGDAEIGAGTNIGAGTIFANYDGVAKHRTVVGDAAFVGSDSVLIAPVVIGDGAYTASGSAITENVPPGALGVARGRQHNSAGWVERRRPGTPSAQAAARARPDDITGSTAASPRQAKNDSEGEVDA
jgi:bifunctional UDP-N-acetylglucosamine pyrophosphorylase/glucosamine-1-phosphate N-acetyltransferase